MTLITNIKGVVSTDNSYSDALKIDALNGAINNSVTTITVDDASSFPSTGTLLIDSEYITYTGTTSTTFTGCTRGANGSTAESHNDDSVVSGVFVGSGEDVSDYCDITVMCTANVASAAGGLSLEFSTDNTNWDKKNTFTMEGAKTETHNTPVVARYFRVVYTNGSSAQSSFRLQTIYHNAKNYSNNDESGNSNVIINNNTSSFGEIISAKLNPVVELDFVYGINTDNITTHTSGTASVVANTQSQIELGITGGSGLGIAQLNSNRLVNYRPGQGIDCRLTTVFATGAENITQIVGIGNEENGVFFGYNGTSFGILRRTSGARQIVTMTITDAGSGTVTVTLNGDTTANITVSGNATIAGQAKIIADSDEFKDLGSGWNAYASGNEVIFVAMTSGARSSPGTYSASGTSFAASFATNITGVDATDTWTLSTSWNTDKADNTGVLPTMDFTKGNVYQIRYQWLGFGMIYFAMENPINGKFVDVHRIRYANSATSVSFRNPKLPICANVTRSTGSNTATMKVPSMAAFVVGEFPVIKPVSHAIHMYDGAVSNQNNEIALLTIRNPVFTEILGTTSSAYSSNTVDIVINSISLFNGHSGSVLFSIYKNTIIQGSVTWLTLTNTSIEYNSSLSNNEYNVSDGTKMHTIFVPTDSTINANEILPIRLRPGETFTVTSNDVSSNNNSDYGVALTWYDDL